MVLSQLLPSLTYLPPPSCLLGVPCCSGRPLHSVPVPGSLLHPSPFPYRCVARPPPLRVHLPRCLAARFPSCHTCHGCWSSCPMGWSPSSCLCSCSCRVLLLEGPPRLCGLTEGSSKALVCPLLPSVHHPGLPSGILQSFWASSQY